MSARYAAIVLAGGFSTRMGCFKPLLPLGAETITDHVIATFLSAGVDVFLVLGYLCDDIKNGIKNRDITIVYNPDYERGMFSSIQAGLGQISPVYKAFFILPVDIPLVRAATVKQLVEIAGKHPGNIVYPVFRGQRGHPPLIPALLAPAILGWHGGDGLKAALESQQKLALEVPVADSKILLDIDTTEDYTELLKRFQRYEIPTTEERDAILNDICLVPPERVRHCYKVAEVTVALGMAVNVSGKSVDLELIRSAALLHDIAKGQSKHDIAGGQILKKLGFAKVGEIVAVHSDLAGGNTNLPLETKIVYLADKFVEGEKLVNLEERYSFTKRCFGLTPEIQAAIAGRLNVARHVKQEFEKILGYPLENIINSLNQ